VIDVFINHLRKKVDLPDRPRLVHTIRGKGFRLTDLPVEEE
jgi:DNA-binding response OmpR family regulator